MHDSEREFADDDPLDPASRPAADSSSKEPGAEEEGVAAEADWHVRPSYRSSEEERPPSVRSSGGSALSNRHKGLEAGPLVLILPLLSMVIAVLWITRWNPDSTSEFAPSPEQDASQRVAGWMGRADLGEGLELIVRLAPFHEDVRQQEFERGALARRFKLGAGQPLRLELSYQRVAGAPDGPRLALQEISVRDATGLAADVPFLKEQALQPGPGQVVDPVVLLFSIPTADLTSGHAISLVLWGRLPAEGAELCGLMPQPMRLEQHDLDRKRMESSLAHLDGAGGEQK